MLLRIEMIKIFRLQWLSPGRSVPGMFPEREVRRLGSIDFLSTRIDSILTSIYIPSTSPYGQKMNDMSCGTSHVVCNAAGYVVHCSTRIDACWQQVGSISLLSCYAQLTRVRVKVRSLAHYDSRL